MILFYHRLKLLSTVPRSLRCFSVARNASISLPASADVVIIGGGSAGCHTLYHLAKRGVKAVLLERAKLTAGTTWHTAGCVWRFRPNDVDVELLTSSRNMLIGLEEETGQDPGWIQNGGIFIGHSSTRLDEYKRLATIGNAFGIENYFLSPAETKKIFPLLDENSFYGALYSPGDGVIDPNMLCTSLTKAATSNGAQVIENCAVDGIILENKKVVGVSTPFGMIRTEVVVNAAGVWGRDLVQKYGVNLPLIPMRHAYIVSETMAGVRGLPNIRDHDFSTYFRVQGDSLCMGGYENNPIILDNVPSDFTFSLYDLDWSVFETHMKGAINLCPEFGKAGIKSTVCGPESFTPDHKPLMGPDPNLTGLFHNCGFNALGIMFAGGCAEQLALWITNGQPDLYMFQFDLKRFAPGLSFNSKWVREKSHESYSRNYKLIFPNDQPMAGRNFWKGPLHDILVEQGAVMEEKQGWERPALFSEDGQKVVQPYDWYGSYGFKPNRDRRYKDVLAKDLTYQFSGHHELIGKEVLACRSRAVLFDMSSVGKMYLDGPEALEAANWIFSGDVDELKNKTVYTCLLNNKGGVEGDVTVSRISSGTGEPHNPKIDGVGYYIVGGGSSAFYSYNNILSEIRAKGFKANLKDVTADMGVISIQGPKSREILQNIVDLELSDTVLPHNSSQLAAIKGKDGKYNVRILRVSFVGELGYELHVPKDSCSGVYNTLMEAGKSQGLSNAGYRALYSLSSEKGYHLWGLDVRSDDTPVEANLGFTCRKEGSYKGKEVVQKQLAEGTTKRLAYFSLKDQIPVWGLEGVYRDGQAVGYLRRGDYAYTLGKSFGQAYIVRKDGKPIDDDFIKSGRYQIDVMGKMYDADCHIRSPFDPKGKRVLGIYK